MKFLYGDMGKMGQPMACVLHIAYGTKRRTGSQKRRAGTELEPSWNRATAHLCSPLLGIARLCSPFAGKLFLERGESRVERLGLRNVKKVQRFAFVRLRSPFGRGEGGGNADGKNETTEEWP